MNENVAQPSLPAEAHDGVLRAKHPYLNVPFFLVRAAIYFTSWNAIAYFLNAWSLEQDRSLDPGIARNRMKFSRTIMTIVMCWIMWALNR